MKKIIINEAIAAGIDKGASILQRKDTKLFIAKTNDEMLSLHRAERVNLIISRIDMPGMACEQLFAVIRNDSVLRSVSLILFCLDRPDDRVRAERCSPDAIMTLPVNSALLLEKAESFLNVPARESYRVLLSANIDGSSRDQSFFCRSENISVTGLQLETERSLALGDWLTCSFFLPDSKRITVAGEVMRAINPTDKSETKRYGVKFGKVAPEDIAAIDAFVKKKAVKMR
ncbi:MAG TPA: PilZ domain-containing protein [Nitrospirota bacterium]|nr:PilZ domain-containing protein [Nitrospirota bacterium]